MSHDLVCSARMFDSAPLTRRVRAAMIEHAVATGVADALAAAVIYDPDSLTRPFVAVCSDDAAVSAYDDPAEVPAGELRRVVAAQWATVAAVVPNLGSTG